MLSLGLQHRAIDQLDGDLVELKPNQVLALFNKVVRKMSDALKLVQEKKEKFAISHLPSHIVPSSCPNIVPWGGLTFLWGWATSGDENYYLVVVVVENAAPDSVHPRLLSR